MNNVVCVKRTIPKLLKEAYPSVFLILLLYQSSASPFTSPSPCPQVTKLPSLWTSFMDSPKVFNVKEPHIKGKICVTKIVTHFDLLMMKG